MNEINKCEITDCNHAIEYVHVTRIVYSGKKTEQVILKRLCKKHSDKLYDKEKRLPIIKKNQMRVYRMRFKFDKGDD